MPYIEEAKTVLKQVKAQENEWVPFVKCPLTEEQRKETPWSAMVDDYDEHRYIGLLEEE